MKYKRFLSIPVLVVFILAGFVYYTTVFIFIEDWLGGRSSTGLLNTSIFSCLAFLCLLSFGTCILKDPGHTPSTFLPDIEGSDSADRGPKKNSVHSRYCDKCCMYKPPRAHHCRVCRRCVLRMDHHCLWINNCVGYSNYKPFFILNFYATVACIYSTVIIMYGALQMDWEAGQMVHLKILYVSCGFIMAALSITLGTLLGWHIYLLSHNMTTIEYYEGIRAMWLARKSGQSYRHAFNLGVYKNFISILGPNVLKWLCPTALSHLKDGVSFPTPYDNL